VQDKGYVLGQMEEGWQPPKYERQDFPRSLQEVSELVKQWKDAVEALLNRTWDELRAKFMVERTQLVEGKERRETAPLRVSVEIGETKEQFGQEEWAARVEEAHEAVAWAWHLLGCDSRNGAPKRGSRGLVEKLREQAKEIAGIQHGFHPFMGSDRRAQEMSGALVQFLKTLVQVDVLLGLERDAQRLLDRELNRAREVLRTADEELEIVNSAVGGGRADVVIAADLFDPLDPSTQTTWLQMLSKAVRRRDRDLFREEVLRGATGLTGTGLRAVLNLRPQADVAEIHDELASHMGQMYNPDGKVYEAPWWAATRAVGTLNYNYRILPRVSSKLRGQLEALSEEQDTEYSYVFTEMGTIGLYVLAFSGISLTREEEDTTSMPAFLLSPFVPLVKNVLDRWVDNPVKHMPSGQVTIVGAGVCGEPLYVKAMRAAGLKDEGIEKIGQFYPLYE
jgi:hypothetical protein